MQHREVVKEDKEGNKTLVDTSCVSEEFKQYFGGEIQILEGG